MHVSPELEEYYFYQLQKALDTIVSRRLIPDIEKMPDTVMKRCRSYLFSKLRTWMRKDPHIQGFYWFTAEYLTLAAALCTASESARISRPLKEMAPFRVEDWI